MLKEVKEIVERNSPDRPGNNRQRRITNEENFIDLREIQ
jgi:hypothetical protein